MKANSVVQLPVSGSAAVSGCVWSQDQLDGSWATGCGQLWELNDGTPKENGMKFCPCCGRTLSESTYTESEPPETDDDDPGAAGSSGGS